MNRIKRGVRIPPGISGPVILWAVSSIYAKYDKDCVLTSGIEGKHGWSSEHFKGDAFDFRTRNLPPGVPAKVAQEVRSALGEEFDIVLHETHLHVEYDPKTPI